jgi:catechol 2,3-dioxygenase-like lactoylglutathione lyase family enzyme
MKEVYSEMSPGHIVVLVSDLKKSIEFYNLAELPVFAEFDQSLALVELRGGAHIILAEKGSSDAEGMEASRYGQQSPNTHESFDLMIAGNTRDELEAYRQRLIGHGIDVSELNTELYFGHYFFSFKDPDENVVFVYTSHEIKYLMARDS